MELEALNELVESENYEQFIPDVDSPEWPKFLVSKLRDDEHTNGHPHIHGLRRLFREFVGEIVDIDITVIQPPSIVTGQKIKIGKERYINLMNPAVIQCDLYTLEDGQKYHYVGVADASVDNVDWNFAMHLSAIAETRAEARALRKALRLGRSISYEEKSPETTNQELPATDSQREFIVIMSQAANIDLKKLLAEKEMNSITEAEANSIIESLKEYRRNPSSIPGDLK